jgi:hypothetical protein
VDSPSLSNVGAQLERGTDAGGHEMNVDSARPAKTVKPMWTPVIAQPKTLQITENERQYMLDLAPIIGRSPRAVKRFINCYRLAKAMLEPGNLEWFSPDDQNAEGNFHCTMFLLAMVSGAPEVATLILDSLKRSSEKTSTKWLDDFRKSPPDHDDSRGPFCLHSHSSPHGIHAQGSGQIHNRVSGKVHAKHGTCRISPH